MRMEQLVRFEEAGVCHSLLQLISGSSLSLSGFFPLSISNFLRHFSRKFLVCYVTRLRVETEIRTLNSFKNVHMTQ